MLPGGEKGAAPARREITGTWDFKWPQGHVIRVAFQAHPLVTAMVVEKVKALALQWTIEPKTRAPRSSVQFEFDPTPFAAPRNPESHGSTSPAERKARAYDVLISLAPLPTFELETPGDPRIEIEAATSQLGTYALRSDYAVPTTYLGCPEGLGDSYSSEGARVDAYFGSRLFEFVVTHEFGHVLGMAHEHQNPNAKLEWASNGRIRDVMRSAWALPEGHELLSDDYIESEITLPWPGGTRFSDWRGEDETVPKKNSIMAHALFRRFLQTKETQPSPEQSPKVPSAYVPVPDIYDAERTAPTDEDIAHLMKMYPYRALTKVLPPPARPNAAQASTQSSGTPNGSSSIPLAVPPAK